ncbi:hypothetical protein GJ496_009139 [Pomphorhynchus laevis]|nr:hypothetical protein GJ496_009139 [Pomphorhynchus laevis]
MRGLITKYKIQKLIMLTICVWLVIYYNKIIANNQTFTSFELPEYLTVEDISTDGRYVENYDQKCRDGYVIRWSSLKKTERSENAPTIISYNRRTESAVPTFNRFPPFVVMYTIESPPHAWKRSEYYDFSITYDWEVSYPFAHTYFSNIDIYLKALLVTPQNTELRKEIVWLCGNCQPFNKRILFVKELMNYLHVDSYGLCLNNVGTRRRYKGNSIELYESYRYIIAIENSNCKNYVTEKFSLIIFNENIIRNDLAVIKFNIYNK